MYMADCLAIVLVLFSSCYGFRCYSEYEFRWWDGKGIEHINGFSMSHFQLKMNSFFREKSTNRLPIKEAFFLVRLHPSYISNLTEECPHALISANLLVSLFIAETGSLDLAIQHFKESIDMFNRIPRIHQEVTLLAWPFAELKNSVENSISLRMSSSRIPRNVTFVILSPEEPKGRIKFEEALSRSFLENFQISRLILLGGNMTPETMLYISKFSFVHSLESLNLSICQDYVNIMDQVPFDWFPVIFVDFKSAEFSPDILVNFMGHLINSVSSSLPAFYSLGHTRALPSMTSTGLSKGGYASNSFVIGQKSDLTSRICHEGASVSLSFESFLRSPTEEISRYHPLRCDDSSLPISLRLCAGNEHLRTDWRDTLLSPVLPRSPVTLID